MSHETNRNFDENEVFRQNLSALNDDVPPMPAELHAQWTALVKEDAMNQPASTPAARTLTFSRRWTHILSVAAAFVFVVTGTLLTKDSLAPATSKEQHAVATASYAEDADGGIMLGSSRASTYAAPESVAESAVNSNVQTESKIIRTASLTIKTSTYETSMQQLETLLAQYGGYVEYSSEATSSDALRNASMTLRVPSESLDAFLLDAEQLGRITRRTISADDVTASYQDTAARLENQRLLLARLQALTDTAGDLADLLALESQLADTQFTIEQLESSLADTDEQVAQATVRLSITEELQADLSDTTVSLSTRLASALHTGWNAFIGFLQDCVVFVTAALPFIGIVVVFAAVVALCRRHRRTRK